MVTNLPQWPVLRALAALLLFCVAACDNAVDAPASGTIAAMAPDGTHIIIGFPDVLSNPDGNESLSVIDETSFRYTVDSISVDSLSGTLLNVTLSSAYTLHSILSVTIGGFRYERGESVSDHPLTITVRAGVLYDREMVPFFAMHCNSCHGSGNASGNYRTDTHDALFEFGSDEADFDRSPNLIPGNDRCQLAVKTGYHGREFRRAGLSFFEVELVRQWILNGDAKSGPSRPGASGIQAHASDFTHVRVWFPTAPDPANATDVARYHIIDIDAPGPELTLSTAKIDLDNGTLVELAAPDQKLFHHYALKIDSLDDRFGNPMFDSASTAYRALLSYQADVAPLCERSCNRCHNSGVPDSARGFYQTDSYSALFALGSDSLSGAAARNLIATDTSCALIIKTRQIAHKTGLCALRAPLTPIESRLISDWIVSFFARQQ
jgi:hypothetical protein